jgi:hypothetical protein
MKAKAHEKPNKGIVGTIAKYCADRGYTDPAIRAMISSGKLIRVKHYYQKTKGGPIRLIFDACDAYWSDNT